MNIGQLKDLVRFEAKIPDMATMGGWFDLVLQEEMNRMTSLHRYTQLFVQDTNLTGLNTSFGTIDLPPDLQHIDMNTVRYLPGGDPNQTRYLRNFHRFSGSNAGFPVLVIRTQTRLQVFPTEELQNTDVLVIDYWRYFSYTADTDEINPPQLNLPLQFRMIARANTFSDSKLSATYLDLEKEAHTKSFGQTDIQPN